MTKIAFETVSLRGDEEIGPGTLELIADGFVYQPISEESKTIECTWKYVSKHSLCTSDPVLKITDGEGDHSFVFKLKDWDDLKLAKKDIADRIREYKAQQRKKYAAHGLSSKATKEQNHRWLTSLVFVLYALHFVCLAVGLFMALLSTRGSDGGALYPAADLIVSQTQDIKIIEGGNRPPPTPGNSPTVAPTVMPQLLLRRRPPKIPPQGAQHH